MHREIHIARAVGARVGTEGAVGIVDAAFEHALVGQHAGGRVLSRTHGTTLTLDAFHESGFAREDGASLSGARQVTSLARALVARIQNVGLRLAFFEGLKAADAVGTRRTTLPGSLYRLLAVRRRAAQHRSRNNAGETLADSALVDGAGHAALHLDVAVVLATRLTYLGANTFGAVLHEVAAGERLITLGIGRVLALPQNSSLALAVQHDVAD